MSRSLNTGNILKNLVKLKILLLQRRNKQKKEKKQDRGGHNRKHQQQGGTVKRKGNQTFNAYCDAKGMMLVCSVEKRQLTLML